VRDKPGVKVREQATRALLAVIFEHQSLDEAIPAFNGSLGDADRSLMQALCYGVMRWHLQLATWMAQLTDRPVRKIGQEVQVLILLGIYQLKYTRIPAHAAIHATVECAPRLKCGRARGMINAVLRNFQRQQDQLEKDIGQDLVASHAHPEWMLSMLQDDWPDDWLAIVEANNRQAPMILRLDTGRMARDQYLEHLSESGLTAKVHPVAEQAIILDTPVDVDRLPGFSEGLVSVQDAAAQLAAPLLAHNASHRVLDACAAPGGKTAHILQTKEPAHLDALDVNMSRLNKMGPLFKRIHKQANLIDGDAAKPETWWGGQQYDRILLDAPCSASGVIRRHPDIKHHRSRRALDKIVRRQARILDALWPLLAPGGILLYVTCSVFRLENALQIKAFLERQNDAVDEKIDTGWGRGEPGRQILPGEDDMDGFYFAKLIKSRKL